MVNTASVWAPCLILGFGRFPKKFQNPENEIKSNIFDSKK